MLGVTDRAREELKRLLTDRTDHPDVGLRLTVGDSGGLRLGLDTEMPGDRVVVEEGLKVLLVEQELADSLLGTSLDVEDTAEGPELVIVEEAEDEQ